MLPPTPNSSELPPSRLILEVISGFQKLIQAEVHLAKAESAEAMSSLSRKTISFLIFGFFAALGVFPLLAFLVLAFGYLMGGSYAMSALLTSLLCFGLGGILANSYLQKIRHQDFSLPESRKSLEAEAKIIRRSFLKPAPTSLTEEQRKVS